jgi:hypothetical protein
VKASIGECSPLCKEEGGSQVAVRVIASHSTGRNGRYTFNNPHGEEGRRRFGGGPVRRLQRREVELPADHAGVELRRAPLYRPRKDVLDGN